MKVTVLDYGACNLVEQHTSGPTVHISALFALRETGADAGPRELSTPDADPG